MTPIRLILGMVLVVTAVGCASNAAHAAENAPTTAPSGTIKMSNAVAIEKLETDGGESRIDSKLRLSKGGMVYFGTIETTDDDDEVVTSIPVIARRLHGDYVAVPVLDPRLKQASWQLLAGGPNRGEAWGVLDTNVEDEQQSEVIIAHTTDGGDTWTLEAIKKPNPQATFDSFCIGPDGHGRVTVYLDGEDAATAKPGYYHYRTTDGGKTWSDKPDYEPDATTPSQKVDEDEEEQEHDGGGMARQS